MSIRRAPPLLIPAASRHTATVIFVHGLGDTGHGWAGAVENWRRRQRLDEVKFILPHAPTIRITGNGGMPMPGWYDIAVFDGGVESLRRNEDEAGILLSQEYFHQMIQKEIDAGIPAERIVLGGFSQGAAISIFAGLTSKVKLGGIVALSSYLLLSLKFQSLVPQPEANRETPVFMAHGDSDPVINSMLGQKSYEQLQKLGYNVSMKIYPKMGHTASLEELDDVEAFLRERLPAIDAQKTPGKDEL